MNASRYIIDYLYHNEIDTYFVVTGGSIVPFIDALSKHENAKYYFFQHEQAAAMAAEGYYRSCGKIACVCVTSGPGVQNIVNGVCGCWYDSVPSIFITGQVNTSEDLSNLTCKPRQSGFQEMPVTKMFREFTKYSIHVSLNDDISDILYTLLKELKTPRYGPVLMDLPVNIQMSQINDKPIQFIKPSTFTLNTYDISEYVTNSTRPLVILGHGVKLSNACHLAIDFIEKYNIPFVVSWGAMDVCETSHTLRVGTIGVYGHRHANYAVQNADLLIIIGSRLDTRQIGGNPMLFSTQSRKIMIDIDINEINKLEEKGIPIDMKVIDDITNFFHSVKINETPNTDNWLCTLNTWKSKFGTEIARKNDSHVYDFLHNFFISLPENCIVICDIGSNMVCTMQSAVLSKSQQLFTNGGNASMGYALPAAIGASIGSNKKIYVIAGDGGFQMNIQELNTVKKYNLPIDIKVLNNSGYGIIKQFQDSYFNSNYSGTSKSDLFGDKLNFKEIAESYGVHSLEDVSISETQKIYPKLEFGNSLENMTPYIEFEDDMLVKVPPKKEIGWN